MPVWAVLLIIVAVAAAIIAAIYFWGKRKQKQIDEQQAQIDAAKQNVTMLIIDKKRMRMKDAGFPQFVLDQASKRVQRTKLYVVKAKVGPKAQTFITDKNLFEIIPLKREVKATVSGLYITHVKALRGSLDAPKKKKESKIDTLLKKGRGEM